MKISDSGINLIKRFEGLRLNAYLCSAKVPTIGYGTTRGIKMGMVITKAQADALLADDVQRFAGHIEALVTVPLAQHQLDALASFVYNIGPGAFAGSTLLRLLNAGLTKEAAGQFPRWNKAAAR